MMIQSKHSENKNFPRERQKHSEKTLLQSNTTEPGVLLVEPTLAPAIKIKSKNSRKVKLALRGTNMKNIFFFIREISS